MCSRSFRFVFPSWMASRRPRATSWNIQIDIVAEPDHLENYPHLRDTHDELLFQLKVVIDTAGLFFRHYWGKYVHGKLFVYKNRCCCITIGDFFINSGDFSVTRLGREIILFISDCRRVCKYFSLIMPSYELFLVFRQMAKVRHSLAWIKSSLDKTNPTFHIYIF